MKTPVSPRTVALIVLGLIDPLPAQNLTCTSYSSSAYSSADSKHRVGFVVPGSYEVPAVQRVKGEISHVDSVLNTQDSLNLDEKRDTAREVESVVDLSLLRSPSVFRKSEVSSRGAHYEVDTNSLQKGLEQISAAYRESCKKEKAPDCSAISLSVEKQIKLDSAKVLEIVEREVGANPGCACEIVKSAIHASDARSKEVVSIAETAIHASPESMRIISQCAIAASPKSVVSVQALITKLEPNGGAAGDSAKSAKSSISNVAAVVSEPPPDPLDRPFIPPLPPSP